MRIILVLAAAATLGACGGEPPPAEGQLPAVVKNTENSQAAKADSGQLANPGEGASGSGAGANPNPGEVPAGGASPR